MSFLIDGLKNYIVYNNEIHRINTSFRVWLEYLQAVQLKDEEKIANCLALICVEVDKKIVNTDQFLIKLKQFAFPLLTNKVDDIKEQLQAEEQRIFDIFFDETLIIADFQREYNINLLDENVDLHWNFFKMLLDNLSNNSSISSRIQLRKVNLKDVDKKHRKEVERQKRAVAIKSEPSKKLTLDKRNELMRQYVQRRAAEAKLAQMENKMS